MKPNVLNGGDYEHYRWGQVSQTFLHSCYSMRILWNTGISHCLLAVYIPCSLNCLWTLYFVIYSENFVGLLCLLMTECVLSLQDCRQMCSKFLHFCDSIFLVVYIQAYYFPGKIGKMLADLF